MTYIINVKYVSINIFQVNVKVAAPVNCSDSL